MSHDAQLDRIELRLDRLGDEVTRSREAYADFKSIVADCKLELARAKPGPSFTPLARADQPSAWARGLLYGGGLTLIALMSAIGYATARPTPRPRAPRAPAPAVARARRWP